MSSLKFNFDRIRIAALRKKALGPNAGGSFGGGGGRFGGGTGGRNSGNRYNPVYDDLSEGTIVEQFMPVDPRRLNRIWRRIKLQDPVAGPAIDMYSELPWSDFQLIGVEDRAIAEVYTDALNAINLTSHMPEISSEFLSMGKVIGHLVMDESRGIWERMIIHDPDWIRVTPIPIPGFQPKLDIIPTGEMRSWAHSKDDRDIDAQREIGELVAMIREGQDIPLPAENTFYIPRRTAPYDVIGASAYTRIIMFVAYEKALVNSTIASSRRRASQIRHITAGIDDVWEPSKEELDDISDLFMRADEDPVGAIVVTRTGVSVANVGGGSLQDMVKISDEWQFLLQGKLNALGVSEAFLTGEACLVGESLIPTTHGLLTIGDLRNRENGQWQDLDLHVDSRYKTARTSKWLYNGYRSTISTTTVSGNSLQSTPNHPVLVLNQDTGVTEWKRTDALSIGDILCLSPRSVTRSDALALTLKDPYLSSTHTKNPTKPVAMTTDLAFLLACVVAEGCFTTNRISFANSNPILMDEYERVWKQVFGLSCARNLIHKKGSSRVVNGVTYNANYDHYDVLVNSTVAKQWLQELGTMDVKSAKKEIPWSVLQSDLESQRAFLAAYLECDGSVHNGKGTISFHSSSKKFLSQIQAMLNSHGYLCDRKVKSVNVLSKDSERLYSDIKPYMVSKILAPHKHKARKFYGIPNGWVRDIITSRRMHHDKTGHTYFRDDSGQKVAIKGWRFYWREEKLFLYDRYEAGAYTKFLNHLKVISISTYDKLMALFELRYRFSAVTKLEDGGLQHVYDISMVDGTEPAFVAQGLVVHNTYNTLEQLLSVFLEKVKAHRKFFEHALIYEKLLKPLAKKHGFVQRKQADLNHRVRTAHSDKDKNYILPTIAWEKSLRPVADRDYLEILQMMEEKGIPITKRTWTSAAGFDLEPEMEQFEDDLEISRQLAAQKKKVGAISPPDMGGGGMGGGLDMGGGGLGDLGGGMGGLGGDMGGGLGGDMGMGGLGGDMGAPPGGAPGAGGAAPAGNLELPQIGASVRTAAAYSQQSEDRLVLSRLRALPIWNKKAEFLGVSYDQAELSARRLLDSLGTRISSTLTQADTRKLISTGNNRKDQVLRYILTRVGILRNADITRVVATDIQRSLQALLNGNPKALRSELQAVLACVSAGDVQASLQNTESAQEVRSNFFRESKAPEFSSDMKKSIAGEKRLGGASLLTGFVADKSILEDDE